MTTTTRAFIMYLFGLGLFSAVAAFQATSANEQLTGLATTLSADLNSLNNCLEGK